MKRKTIKENSTGKKNCPNWLIESYQESCQILNWIYVASYVLFIVLMGNKTSITMNRLSCKFLLTSCLIFHKHPR